MARLLDRSPSWVWSVVPAVIYDLRVSHRRRGTAPVWGGPDDPDYYGVERPPLRGHDALDDALSIAYTLQHLLRIGALSPQDFHEQMRQRSSR
jgi:hypothetical protein